MALLSFSSTPELNQNNQSLLNPSLKFIILCEKFAQKYKWTRYLYYRLFYQRVINDEIRSAEIKEGDKVAHIGTGYYPITAITLANAGASVDTFDINDKIVQHSQKLINTLGLGSSVNVYNISEKSPDFSSYKAVFVSLHIIEKHKLVQTILEQISDDGILVYRNSRGLLKSICRVACSCSQKCVNVHTIKHRLFKESVVLKKPKPLLQIDISEKESNAEDMTECLRYKNKTQSLLSLSPDKTALICNIPKHSLLEPLGIRPGKEIKVLTVHPLGGPAVIQAGRRSIAISRHIAQKIGVHTC